MSSDSDSDLNERVEETLLDDYGNKFNDEPSSTSIGYEESDRREKHSSNGLLIRKASSSSESVNVEDGLGVSLEPTVQHDSIKRQMSLRFKNLMSGIGDDDDDKYDC